MGKNKILGVCLMGTTFLFMAYYTVWVLVLPFTDKVYLVEAFFPDQIFAFTVPLVLGLVGLFLIGLYLAVVLFKDSEHMQKPVINSRGKT